MAEGFVRTLGGDRFEVESAGTEATQVHPLAIRAMELEAGIDLRGHTSKTLDRFLADKWDYVITLLQRQRAVPALPGRGGAPALELPRSIRHYRIRGRAVRGVPSRA